MLTVIGMTCLRGERAVLRDISFDLHSGQALIVRGANGSGKSTLLRVLAGLLRPLSGRIALDGCDLKDDPAGYRQGLCWLGHHDGMKPGETVEQFVRFQARLHHVADGGSMMGAFALEALRNRPGRELSAGQKRRTALAGMAASRAHLWLLDEPATALDTASAALFHEALDRHLAAGGTAVIASHDARVPAGAHELHL